MLNSLRTQFSAAYYKPLLFKSAVMGASGRAGHIGGLGDKVTQSERFYLMEERFEALTHPVLDHDAGSGDGVGGNTMYSGRVEILSSLGLDKIPECAGQYSAISAHFGVQIIQQM